MFSAPLFSGSVGLSIVHICTIGKVHNDPFVVRIKGMKPKGSFVFAVRQAVGETQPVFAERLGVSLRALKRYELENALPSSKAVLRVLESLAKEHSIGQENAD